MKLIFCSNCQDMFKLGMQKKTCKCGSSSGRYIDGLNAEIKGKYVIPIGIDNKSFLWSLSEYKKNGEKSLRFHAFIIEKNCKTVDIKI